MSIAAKIDQDLIQALKAGDKVKVTVLRGLKSDLKYKRIEIGEDLTDEQATGVLSSAAKRHRESIEQFKAGGRGDLVEKETAELEIISAYLPKQLGEGELRTLITAAIAKTGADSPQKIGLVMKELMPQIKGKADGKLVNRLVTEFLAK